MRSSTTDLPAQKDRQQFYFHPNRKRLSDFAGGTEVDELMRILGNYLQLLNDPQRIAMWYLSGAMLADRMKRKYYKHAASEGEKRLVCDGIIFSIIPTEIGAILERMSGQQLTAVIQCVSENSDRNLWISCDSEMP